MKEWLIVVPARLHSTRLPEKPLKDLHGKPMIVRVCENLQPLEALGAKLVVATDSEAILKVCHKHGIDAAITSKAHKSGTDRCYEVALKFKHKFILNVQGDEPFVSCTDLEKLCSSFIKQDSADMATLVFGDSDLSSFNDPNNVKVVTTKNMRALYFSRSSIPYDRSPSLPQPVFLSHLGVYAYAIETLEKFVNFEPSELEKTEKLEQLRVLDNDMSILCVLAEKKTHGIDTQEDLDRAVEVLKKMEKPN